MQDSRLKMYFLATVFSVIFAVVGLSYNTWRLEKTESNNNIRTASFAVLTELAEFEQLIYTLHYDKNFSEGSPRKGWIKVGLISDLSMLISHPVSQQSEALKAEWSQHWSSVVDDKHSATTLVNSIDSVRQDIKTTLIELD